MTIHPTVSELGGIVSVQLAALFTGANTDTTDRQLIQGYGDPQVNLAGLFTDPNQTSFTFTFPVNEQYVGITTQMPGYTVRFMTALPPVSFGQPQPLQGPLDCITTDPNHAATVWAATMQTRVAAAMVALRSKTVPLTSLPDSTV